ncbi:helix-turn-helix domain-containing protein [Bradyrhizobium sp. CCBAU 45384]|uniref:helix-turn-helix domain-containing protein n=1 Tax=Bradyrhizobium sp. CCBAU 45384 TaxID=858428 RepID=UPI003FA49691
MLNNPIEFWINRVGQHRRAHKPGQGQNLTKSRNLRRPWSPEEEERLISLLCDGATADEIGERLGRTRQSVYARIQRFQRQRGRASRTSGKFFLQLPVV